MKVESAPGIAVKMRNYIGYLEKNEPETEIAQAAKYGYFDVVKCLSRGCDLDEAVVVACKYGHFDILKCLVDAGAELDERLSLLVYENLEMLEYIIERAGGADLAMGRACRKGYLPTVKHLAPRADLTRALVSACIGGNLDVVEFLIDFGASICSNAVNNACEHGHFRIVVFLAGHGADIRADNDIPLALASRGGHYDVVKFLIKRGANAKSNNSVAAKRAAESGHLEIFKLLLDNGAKPCNGWDDALILASVNGHLEIIKLLFDRKLVDRSKISKATDYAKRYANDNVVEFLRAHAD